MTPARQRSLIAGMIVAGILLAGFFGLRAIHAFKQFRGHRPPPFSAAEMNQAETDVDLIREWMTIPYISKTYQVPPKILFDALGIPPRGNEEKNLAQLNEEYFPQAPGLLMELVKAAIRANQPAPTVIIPETPIPALTSVPPVNP